jgi:sodium-dependent phosphate cotransporter
MTAQTRGALPAEYPPTRCGLPKYVVFVSVAFAAFAVVGRDAKIDLQAAFVHLLYNVFAIIAIRRPA